MPTRPLNTPSREEDTTPPSNLFGANPDLAFPLWFHYQRISKVDGGNTVKFHQAKLGKQDYCFQGEFRYWVWNRPGCRLFVSNQKGVCFEVPYEATEEDVREARDNYLKDIGLPNEASFIFQG